MIEQEVEQTHREDAVVIHVRLHHLVHHGDPLKAVTDETQRALLLLALDIVSDTVARASAAVSF